MDKNNLITEKIKRCKKKNIWNLGNSVLYNLCENNPYHKTEEEIIAKLWLIGRSYAAAIERRKIKDGFSNDEFYIHIANQIKKEGNIDKMINECKFSQETDCLLRTHHNLSDLFFRLTGLKKRSLASKYLHFHLPEKFFIYDSRAEKGIKKLLKELGVKSYSDNNKSCNYDKQYNKFYHDCLAAKEQIRKKYSVDLTCRELDILILDEIAKV